MELKRGIWIRKKNYDIFRVFQKSAVEDEDILSLEVPFVKIESIYKKNNETKVINYVYNVSI